MTGLRRVMPALLLGMATLGGAPGPRMSIADRPAVGIAMPSTAQVRWVNDGNELVASLAARGYRSDLQNAGGDVTVQIAQIQEMVSRGDTILVVTAIDDRALGDVLRQAAAHGVKIIAYDRLLQDTPNVDDYASFDNFEVGILQAQSLLKGMGMRKATGPFEIELFGGSPDDGNSYLFFNGAMSILKPLIDAGRLVVRSGQTTMEAVSTLRWDPDAARARMDNLLSAYYAGQHLDGVLSPYDGLSIAIIASLEAAGYGPHGIRMPIVTGQDCEIPAVKAIIAGLQYSSVFKDTRRLADVAAEMVDALATGKPIPVNDPSGYSNGVKSVPADLLMPSVVTRGTITTLLIQSGYYSRAQVY